MAKEKEGSFDNPVEINSFKELNEISLDTWIKIYGRKELKTSFGFLGRESEKYHGREYTISLEYSPNGIKLLSFNHYVDFPSFEGMDLLIYPFIKEVYRFDKNNVSGASKIIGKLNSLGYKEKILLK